MLQVTVQPSEPPYQAIDLTTRQLLDFLTTCEDLNQLSNFTAIINLLEQYEPRCPILQLKVPFLDAFPTVEN